MSWGFGEIVFVLSLALILVLSLFLVFCRRYDEGVVGNPALWLIVIVSAIALWDARAGALELPQPMYRLVIIALAVFMARHTWRFAMFHWCGFFGWRRPSDCGTQTSDAH